MNMPKQETESTLNDSNSLEIWQNCTHAYAAPSPYPPCGELAEGAIDISKDAGASCQYLIGMFRCCEILASLHVGFGLSAFAWAYLSLPEDPSRPSYAWLCGPLLLGLLAIFCLRAASSNRVATCAGRLCYFVIGIIIYGSSIYAFLTVLHFSRTH